MFYRAPTLVLNQSKWNDAIKSILLVCSRLRIE